MNSNIYIITKISNDTIPEVLTFSMCFFFYYRGDWQILLLLSNEKEKVEVAALKLFLSTVF